MIRRILSLFILISLLISPQLFHANANPFQLQHLQNIRRQAPSLPTDALKAGLTSFQHAKAMGLDKSNILTIIDYAEPSSKKRLWVIDMNRDKVLYETLVAHGKNSGDNYVRRFSDEPRSLASSIGVFQTVGTYYGKNGLSLRLEGLEKGFNTNAYRRDVVIHGADYVSEQIVRKFGRLGRSWGCPALSKEVAPSVINTIKNGTLLVVFYPDQRWLSSSRFLV